MMIKKTLSLYFLLIFSSFAMNDTSVELTVSSEKNLYNLICQKILKEAFVDQHIKLKFSVSRSYISIVDSSSGFTDAEACRIDGATKKYPDLIKVSPPISSFEGAILTNGNRFEKITSLKILKNLRIGILRGHIYSRNITNNLNQQLVKELKDNETTLNMLKDNKIDVAILMLAGSAKVISENPEKFSSLVFNNRRYVKHDLFFYIHKKNKKHLDALTKTISTFVNKGSAKKVRSTFLKRYGISFKN